MSINRVLNSVSNDSLQLIIAKVVSVATAREFVTTSTLVITSIS